MLRRDGRKLQIVWDSFVYGLRHEVHRAFVEWRRTWELVAYDDQDRPVRFAYDGWRGPPRAAIFLRGAASQREFLDSDWSTDLHWEMPKF